MIIAGAPAGAGSHGSLGAGSLGCDACGASADCVALISVSPFRPFTKWSDANLHFLRAATDVSSISEPDVTALKALEMAPWIYSGVSMAGARLVAASERTLASARLAVSEA